MFGHSILSVWRGEPLAIAWLLLMAAVSIHVYDEARNGFLAVYNPTAVRIRERFPLLPLPIFSYRRWKIQLIASIAIAISLTPLSVHLPAVFRPVAAFVAVAMILNGLSHLIGTVLGHTYRDIKIPRPMPGTYSSPTMILAALGVLAVLIQT